MISARPLVGAEPRGLHQPTALARAVICIVWIGVFRVRRTAVRSSFGRVHRDRDSGRPDASFETDREAE